MASLPGPISLPDPKAKNKPAKVKIDIPYNRPEQRIRRAIKSFILITLLLSVVSILVIFASNGDVELNLVVSAVSSIFGAIITLAMYIVPLIMTYGALLWFLGRPKVEVIFRPLALRFC